MDEMTIKTKHTLLPIVITLGIALMLSIIGIASGITIAGAPFSETEGGLFFALLNALFYTLFAIIGITVIYYAIKYGKEKVLRIFFILCFGFMGVFLIFFFLYLMLAIFEVVEDIYFILVVIISIVAGLYLSYSLLAKNASPKAKNTALLLFGAFIGAFLGIVLPTWTAFLLIGILSVYDIIAVFRGPIKKIIEMTEENEESGLPVDMTYATQGWEIGLGDLAFYSMLSTHTLILGFQLDFLVADGLLGAIIPCVCTTVGILIGAIITFKLLKKRPLLPGLPISVGLGILFYLLSLLMFWLF